MLIIFRTEGVFIIITTRIIWNCFELLVSFRDNLFLALSFSRKIEHTTNVKVL